MLVRVRQNHRTYLGYLIMSVLSVAALVVIGIVLALGDTSWAAAAYVLFAEVVIGYGCLFAYEVSTTIRQMNDLETGLIGNR
jgi:hypothetical protein